MSQIGFTSDKDLKWDKISPTETTEAVFSVFNNPFDISYFFFFDYKSLVYNSITVDSGVLIIFKLGMEQTLYLLTGFS